MTDTLNLAMIAITTAMGLLVGYDSRRSATSGRRRWVSRAKVVIGVVGASTAVGVITGIGVGVSATPGKEMGMAVGIGLGVTLFVIFGVMMIAASEVALISLVNDVQTLRTRPIKAIESQSHPRPPQFAEYLLYFLPKNLREPLLGDLEEEYYAVYAKFGKRKAAFWYYAEVALSFYPVVYSWVRRLVKWGVLGWISGVVKRLIP